MIFGFGDRVILGERVGTIVSAQPHRNPWVVFDGSEDWGEVSASAVRHLHEMTWDQVLAGAKQYLWREGGAPEGASPGEVWAGADAAVRADALAFAEEMCVIMSDARPRDRAFIGTGCERGSGHASLVGDSDYGSCGYSEDAALIVEVVPIVEEPPVLSAEDVAAEVEKAVRAWDEVRWGSGAS